MNAYVTFVIMLVRRKRSAWSVVAWVVAVLIAAVAAGVLFIYIRNRADNPIPKSISRQLDFPVYYPDPKKLPPGYALDPNSFIAPATDVLLYSINYNGGKLVFSEQVKPSQNNLNLFNTQRIPLHTTLKTNVGEAVIGAIGNQSIVSLPTSSNTWILITAPYATNQNNLKTVLTNLRSAH